MAILLGRRTRHLILFFGVCLSRVGPYICRSGAGWWQAGGVHGVLLLTCCGWWVLSLLTDSAQCCLWVAWCMGVCNIHVWLLHVNWADTGGGFEKGAGKGGKGGRRYCCWAGGGDGQLPV